MKTKNTVRSTNNWVKRYQTWAHQQQLPTKLSTIPTADLDKILQQYFAVVCRTNGENYEPESLKVMHSSINRYLREKGYGCSILKDKEFEKSRKILNGKAVDLQEKGKGKRPMRADPLTEKEESQLWSSGVLGSDNPTSLNYTIF